MSSAVTHLLPKPGDYGPGPGPNSMMGSMHANFSPMTGGPQGGMGAGPGMGGYAPGGMGAGPGMGGYAGPGVGPGSMMGMQGMGMMQGAGVVLEHVAASWAAS